MLNNEIPLPKGYIMTEQVHDITDLPKPSFLTRKRIVAVAVLAVTATVAATLARSEMFASKVDDVTEAV